MHREQVRSEHSDDYAGKRYDIGFPLGESQVKT